MTYTFRTRCELIKHLRALCELSGSIQHSSYPLKDFEIELPTLMGDLLVLKKLAIKFTNNSKIYIAFRTQGFECHPTFSSFKSRVACFTNVIACYTIQFVDGYYTLQQFTL